MIRFFILLLLLKLSLFAEFHEAKADRFTFESAQKHCRDLGNGE
ncbi:MAG: hypothetical protein U9Q62_03165 [Campylobacterota bacterium]|nr:hypothetical protein [Campylobacterota bacterium]